MANSISIAALRVQLWRKQLFADVRDSLYMQRFIGPAETNMIQEMTDLKGTPGYRITFGLGIKLSGNGITGDSELEGNEEAMTDYSETIDIDQLRNAVRLTGRMDEKQNAYKMRTSANLSLHDALPIYIRRRTDRSRKRNISNEDGHESLGRGKADSTASLSKDSPLKSKGQRALCSDSSSVRRYKPTPGSSMEPGPKRR